METLKLFEAEYKFMEIIWEASPINSTELVKKANEILGWKKSTTYTVIRKLCNRGIIKNEDAIVQYIVPKEEVQMRESQEVVNRFFNGSLKLFMAGFLSKEKLTQKEALELKKLIDERTQKGE